MRTLGYLLRSCVLWVVVCAVLAGEAVEYNSEILDDATRMVGPGDAKMGPAAKSAPVNLYPAPVCHLQPSFANYCHHRGAGLYTYTADYNCFIQCDEWGKTFIKPCAYGTFWKPDGYEPTLYNRCVGRKAVHTVHHPGPHGRSLQTSHVRNTQQYVNPATGQNVVHTSGSRVTSYARNGLPAPTNVPNGQLNRNDLVNLYVNGKPSLNKYVFGKSGGSDNRQMPGQQNQPQVHNIAAQPKMQPMPQVQPTQQMLPQTQVYRQPPPPQPQVQLQPIQFQRPPPPQALAQKLQLPNIPTQNQGQQQPRNIIQPIRMQPIKISLPPPSQPQQPQQKAQQQQPQRITLNSRFPLVANKGQGMLNLPKVNTNGMMSNGPPLPLKQFNLQKQKLLAKNFQLPGLKNKNNIPRNPGMMRNPGFIKKNLQLQKQRSQGNGRPNLRKLINMRRKNGNQNGMANARLLAERKRRLQQWRQFMKNKKRGGRGGRIPLNGQGGGERGRIATAVLNDQHFDNQPEDDQDDISVPYEDDDIINLDELFGDDLVNSVEAEDGFENHIEEVPLFDFTRDNDDDEATDNSDDVNVDFSNGSTDEVIEATEGLLNNDDNVVVSNDSSEVIAAEKNLPK